MFPELLLCVKNWREKFLLTLLEALKDESSQNPEMEPLGWNEGWHMGRGAERDSDCTLKQAAQNGNGGKKVQSGPHHVANDALSLLPVACGWVNTRAVGADSEALALGKEEAELRG